jgi:hypothetical protein
MKGEFTMNRAKQAGNSGNLQPSRFFLVWQCFFDGVGFKPELEEGFYL